MKVALLAQCMYYPWNEGIKNNSLFLAKELKNKVNLEIISHKPYNKQIKEDTETLDLKINYLLSLSDNKFLQLWYFFLDWFKVLFFMLKKGINIISVQYLETSFLFPLFLLILFKKNIKIILTLYSTDELRIWYKKIFLKLFKNKFKKIIIISQYLRDEVRTLWFKDEDIEYIPLSYDKQRYCHLADFEKRNKKTILFSAWIRKEAGSFFMVDLAKIMPDYHFIFTLRQFNKKSEDELSLLMNYIEQKKVKNIEIRRNISNMEKVLWEVWCLVLPLQDIHIKMLIPVALLEAMARGTICFVSDLPNLKVLVDDKKNAIIFKKNNPLDLKDKINSFIKSEEISLSSFKFGEKFPDYTQIWKQYFTLRKNDINENWR